jgi:hypothetical protein
MKRILFVAVLGVLALAAQAQPPKDNVGIGIGTIIFDGQEGLLSQICAATTNGCFGNQTFAISTGTLGADQPSTLVRTETLKQFVAGNMDNLAQDIAVGKGEALDTVAELLAVPADKRADFCKRAQASFGSIYSSDKVTHQDVLQALDELSRT